MGIPDFFMTLLSILLAARLLGELGRATGIFTADVHAVLVLVVALTTLLPPFMLKAFYRRYGGGLDG
jgi:hypothetical protein